VGDEIMKAYTCGARAAFDGPPEKCPIRKGSKCRVSEPMLDCDAEPIYVYPKARHAATQAALAAAEFAIAGYLERGVKPVWPDILAKLRKAKGESDD